MGRGVRDVPPWEELVPAWPGIVEDRWFGTYWIERDTKLVGPFNTVQEVKDYNETLCITPFIATDRVQTWGQPAEPA